MKNLTKQLLYKGDNVARANVVWNIAGSFVYAFASMVLSFLVIRMAGEEKGGIFSFGYSTLGQQLFLVAYFGIRPFQITDGKGEYSFKEYREHRNITCMFALVAGALFLTARTIAFRKGIGDYTAGKCMILLLLVIYKVIDGYADVYESEFQRQGCLYLTGKSNFFRTVFSVAVFTVTLGAFKHLLFACLMAVAAQAMGVFLFNLDVIHALNGVDWTFTKGKVTKLFKNTGFLFISVFLDFYIFSSAKYAIDARMNNAASGYFNLIFMPTSVIYMVANFVIRPYLTTLTNLWTEEKIAEFKKTLVRIAAVILGLTCSGRYTCFRKMGTFHYGASYGRRKGNVDRLFWGICRDRPWRRFLCTGKSDVLRTGDHAKAENRVFCIRSGSCSSVFPVRRACWGFWY